MFKVRKRIKGLKLIIVDDNKLYLELLKRLIIENSMPF